MCVCSPPLGLLTTYGKALEDTIVATAACSLVSGMHVQGMQGLSTGRSPAAWNVIQAATRYACLCSTAASCREYSFLHVLLTFHMCAGTGLHCNGSQCMAEAFWRPMSQEGFIETCQGKYFKR